MARWYYTPPQDSEYIELSTDEYDQLHGWAKRTRFQKNWAGSLQLFVDIYKDFRDTLKPYKGNIQELIDLLQPIFGIPYLLLGAGLFVMAILGLVLSPLIVGGDLLYNIYLSENREESNKRFSTLFLGHLSWCIRGLIMAVSSVLRGITLVAFTPLTWFIKMPIRALITLIQGEPLMEDSESFQRILRMGSELLPQLVENKQGMVDINQTSMPAIIKGLTVKIRHSIEKGKLSNLDEGQRTGAYRQLEQFIKSSVHEDDSSEIQWKPVLKKELHDLLTLFARKNTDLIEKSDIVDEGVGCQIL